MQDRKSKLVRFCEKSYEGVVDNREVHRRIGRPKCKVNYIGGGNTWRPCEKMGSLCTNLLQWIGWEDRSINV